MTILGLAWVAIATTHAAGVPVASSLDLVDSTALPAAGDGNLVLSVYDADDTGGLPARIIVTAPDGSHPDGSGNGVYRDGRFFADGECSVTVPPGDVRIQVRCGPNYVPLDARVQVESGKRVHVAAHMARWFAPEERGWYAGDNHVHAQHDPTAAVKTSLTYTALQGRANGLSFMTEAGSNLPYDQFHAQSTDAFLFRMAREARAGCYSGHLNTPGIAKPIAGLEELLRCPLPAQAVCTAAHDLGGVATYTHPLTPPYQLHWMGAVGALSDAAMGRCADMMDIDSRQTELLWFAILNLGNRVGCSSCTDCGLGRVGSASPGDRRLYCNAREFTYEAMVDAMRTGRTIATSGGPVFAFLTVDGHPSGGVLEPSAVERRIGIEIHALHPLKEALLYRNGNMAREFDVGGEAGHMNLDCAVAETGTAWFVAKVRDSHGDWAITSPVYVGSKQPGPVRAAHAIVLEISNCNRFTQLRRGYFAHILATVSDEQTIASVELLKDGNSVRRVQARDGDRVADGKIPVTELAGEYREGWIWCPSPDDARHVQIDWPVAEAGWYAVRTTMEGGQRATSDAVYFNPDAPNSQELSVANLNGPGTSWALWGYGEEMPMSEVQDGKTLAQSNWAPGADHWYYPKDTFWRTKAVFGGQEHVVGGGKEETGGRLFRAAR